MTARAPWIALLAMAAVLAGGAARAETGMRAAPIPKAGFCPGGYRPDGNACVPNNANARPAIPKVGFCPGGWHPDGKYCIANGLNPPYVMPRRGFCPSRYHPDGSYCVRN